MADEVILTPSLQFDNPKQVADTFIGKRGWFEVGKSAGNRSIWAKKINSNKGGIKPKILFIGGVHGNENEGVAFAVDFCKEFAFENETTDLSYDFYLLPIFNPDGFIQYKRQNDNGVDLNRNMATKDWSSNCEVEKYFPGVSAGSEPESKILAKIIDDFQPNYILSLHSWKPMINTNGPVEEIAHKMYNSLPPNERIGDTMHISDDIGYPTPGSLGTYTGWEKKIPTITLEFARGDKLEEIYPRFRDMILAGFEVI